MFYLWLGIVVILSIIEFLTTNLTSIWFVISALVTMIISLLTDNLFIQVSVFVLLGVVLMLCTKKIVKKILPAKIRTNIDRIIGMKGQVVSEISPKRMGEVKVDGKVWAAIADEKISCGSIVKILEINSTKLKVEKIKE